MRRWISISVILILLGCLCGCGRSQDSVPSETTLGENMIHLYIVEGDRVLQSDEDYQLKTPDSVSSSIDDVMSALLLAGDETLESYSYMLGEDNSLILELSVSEEMNKEQNLLMMAAITQTLFQLKDIASIQMTVKTRSEDVLEEQLYLRDSFFFYGYDEESLAEEDICVYVPTDDRLALKRIVIKGKGSPNISNQELIVEELVKQNVLPQGTHVNMVSVHDSLCYLDLSEEFIDGTIGAAPELAVYAIVNSVAEQCGIETVQIMVDGEILNMYRGTVEIGKPLSFNSDVIE